MKRKVLGFSHVTYYEKEGSYLYRCPLPIIVIQNIAFDLFFLFCFFPFLGGYCRLSPRCW